MYSPALTAAVFDIGGVLIDWNPRHLYRKIFNSDEEAMESFLSNVCTRAWHIHHDDGRTFAEGAAQLIELYPDKAELIGAWGKRFQEMIAGPIYGAVDILAELNAHKTPLFALTNFPQEAFPATRKRFDFFESFQGIVVSGDEKISKPDPRLYRILMERYRIDPSKAVFIDDSGPNVKTACDLGFTGILFTSPTDLRQKLQNLGLLQPVKLCRSNPDSFGHSIK